MGHINTQYRSICYRKLINRINIIGLAGLALYQLWTSTLYSDTQKLLLKGVLHVKDQADTGQAEGSLLHVEVYNTYTIHINTCASVPTLDDLELESQLAEDESIIYTR